jgi:hypothetical protein
MEETNIVSHEQIYERLIKVEAKVDSIDKNTRDLIEAFNAFQGAFRVLNWIASLAKPIAMITALVAIVGVGWHNLTGK